MFGVRQRRLGIDEHIAMIDGIVNRDTSSAETALLDNIGAVEDEIASISRQPQLLQTIQDLNGLVALDQRARRTKARSA